MLESTESPSTESLDPSVVTLWRVQSLIRLITVLGPIIIGGIVISWERIGIAGLIIGITLFFLLLVLQVGIWPQLTYDRFRYELRDDALYISRGVLFKQQSVVPLSRLQHVDTHQGPIERIFGLWRVLVFTASGGAPDGGIPGLAEAIAASLRDELAKRSGADGL